MITIGVFLAALVGYGFVQYVPSGWIYVQVSSSNNRDIVPTDDKLKALIGLPAVINFVGMQMVPESPKWLVTQHRWGLFLLKEYISIMFCLFVICLLISS